MPTTPDRPIAYNRLSDRRRNGGRWIAWWAIVFDVHHTATAIAAAIVIYPPGLKSRSARIGGNVALSALIFRIPTLSVYRSGESGRASAL